VKLLRQAALAALAAAAAAAPGVAADVIPARGAPTLGPGDAVPARFSARITNPWFPLRPGSVYRYRGTKDGRPIVVITRVTRRVTRIMGIPAAVVSDRLFVAGRLAEDTIDWYSQDARGNVWYLGEDTAALANGRVRSREGSFRAGRGGARGGIVMPARPRAGAEFRQELLVGQAEDRFRIARIVTAPGAAGRPVRTMRTLEWSPLEPAVVDAKTYVRGVGIVSERQIRGPGPPETLELVARTRG
jgi:hypothetical protein